MLNKETIGLIISGLGIADTALLVDETYNNSGICTGDSSKLFGYLIDCGGILKSQYSKLFNIPLALWGFIFYLSMFVLFNLYNDQRKYISKLLLTGASIGFLASSVFVYLQLVIIKLICLYCMGSALTSISLFLLMILSYKNMSNSNND